MMGFLDEASNLLNRGVANAGRGTRSLSIKAQLNDLKKQREDLCRQLGAALFELTREDAGCRAPHEALYTAIEALDAQSSSLRAELAAIEQQAHLSQPGASGRCPVCASPVGLDDAFCVTCGTRIAPPDTPQAPVRFCYACGAPLGADVQFCVECGASVDLAPAPEAREAADAAEAMPVNSELVDASSDPSDSQPTSILEEPAALQADPAGVTQMIDAIKPPAPPAPRSYAPAPHADTSGLDRMVGAAAAMSVSASAPASAVYPPAPPAPAFIPIGQQAGLCANCGYENASDAVFCRNCGQRL